MASIGTNKGNGGQPTVAELERQLTQLKRRLAAAHEQKLKQLERLCKQAATRIDQLRRQYGQAQDRVAIARDEARMKPNLTADRQLQRAQAKATELKAALDAARGAEGELKQEFRRQQAALQIELRVARALDGLRPTPQPARSAASKAKNSSSNISKKRSVSEPGSKPSASKQNLFEQDTSEPNASKSNTSKSSASKSRPTRKPNSGRETSTAARDHQSQQPATSAPPSALEPAGGEALVNQIRREVASELREMSDAQPAAAVVKMSTRVAPETASPESRSAAPRPAPVSIPPAPAAPNQPAEDTGLAAAPEPQPPGSPATGGDAGVNTGVKTDAASTRAKTRDGHVRSLFDLLDE